MAPTFLTDLAPGSVLSVSPLCCENRGKRTVGRSGGRLFIARKDNLYGRVLRLRRGIRNDYWVNCAYVQTNMDFLNLSWHNYHGNASTASFVLYGEFASTVNQVGGKPKEREREREKMRAETTKEAFLCPLYFLASPSQPLILLLQYLFLHAPYSLTLSCLSYIMLPFLVHSVFRLGLPL